METGHDRSLGERGGVLSVRVGLLPAQDTGTAGRDRGTANNLHPPLKSIFALRPEVINMGFEMQLEDVVLVDVFRLRGNSDRVA